MKSVRDQLRAVLESEGELRNLVIVFQFRGKKAEAVHNFETTAAAIAFVNGALLLSDDELLKVLRGRQPY
jgi:hypothetical protein